MNIFYGLLGVIASFALIKYRSQIIGFTGHWGWAERYLGSGGSYMACFLLGVLVFFISVTMMTGLLDDMILSFFGPLIGV